MPIERSPVDAAEAEAKACEGLGLGSGLGLAAEAEAKASGGVASKLEWTRSTGPTEGVASKLAILGRLDPLELKLLRQLRLSSRTEALAGQFHVRALS